MDLNLDTLKQRNPGVSRTPPASPSSTAAPGGLEGLPMVLWDTERYPDYQMFLEVASKTGVKLILFATREFEAADLDELAEQLEECELTRDEQRDYEVAPARAARLTKASPARSNWPSITNRASTSTKCSPTGTKSSSASKTRSDRASPSDDEIDEDDYPGRLLLQELNSAMATLAAGCSPADDARPPTRWPPRCGIAPAGRQGAVRARVRRPGAARRFLHPVARRPARSAGAARHAAGRRAPAPRHRRRREDPDLRRLRRGRHHLRGAPDQGHRAGRRRGRLITCRTG